MNATAIRQGISYVTNSTGEKTALQLDITNSAVREMVEDLMDTLDAIEGHDEPTQSFEDFKNEILLGNTKKYSQNKVKILITNPKTNSFSIKEDSANGVLEIIDTRKRSVSYLKIEVLDSEDNPIQMECSIYESIF